MKYSINGYIKANPEKREELLGYLLEASKEMNAVETCHIYIVGVNPEESDNIYVYEVWDSEEAHKASLSLPIFQALIQKARPIIAGIESYPSLMIYGGKGLKE